MIFLSLHFWIGSLDRLSNPDLLINYFGGFGGGSTATSVVGGGVVSIGKTGCGGGGSTCGTSTGKVAVGRRIKSKIGMAKAPGG